MADNEQAIPGQSEAPEQRFSLKRIYVKDLSFEAPNSPEIFENQLNPKIDFNLSTRHKFIKDSYYEVVLKLSADAKYEDKSMFLVEVEQAGIFDIHGIEENQMEPILAVMCPNVLYPYARETIDNLVLKGSFPPLMLDAVNFEVVYAHSLQQKEAQQAAQPKAQ